MTNVRFLEGKCVALMRSLEQGSESLWIFEQAGAEVLLVPTIKVVPPESYDEFDSAAARFEDFRYLIFTSVNAVKMTAQRFKELGVEKRHEKLKVVAVGSKTAQACIECGFPVNIVPQFFSAKGVIERLKNEVIPGKEFFIPASAIAGVEIRDRLIMEGGKVVQVPVYDVDLPDENINRDSRELLELKHPEIFVFTSPSTFRNFVRIFVEGSCTDYFENKVVAAIGPSTAKEISGYGVNVSLVPEEFTLEGVLRALYEFFSKERH